MNVRRLSLLTGARNATGIAVIIDVYRAFTTAAVAFQRGASQIVFADSPQAAFSLFEQGAGELIVGEAGGKRVPGFDFGNSPAELSTADVAGKSLIQSTSAGTRGVVAAEGAEAIFVASLVNAAETVAAIRRLRPAVVSVVAMGSGGETPTEEDEQCAAYIAARLQDQAVDLAAVRAAILGAPSSRRFDDPSMPHFRRQDREIALQIDSIPLAMPVGQVDGMLVATSQRGPG